MNISGYSHCDCFVSSPSIGIIVHLKVISKLKAGSVPNVEVASGNADTILVAINNQCNMNINVFVCLC